MPDDCVSVENFMPKDQVITAVSVDELKSRSVHGAASYFLRTLFLQGIGMVSLLFLSSFLEPSEFGVYGLVTQIIGLLVFFSDVGLAAVLIQKAQQPTIKDYRTAFTLQQILSWLIVALSLLLIYSGVLDQKIGVSGKWLLLSLALSFPLATLKTIPSIILERELNFSKLVMPQIFEQIVFHLTVVVLAWQGWGVIAYAYAVILRSLTGVVVMNIIQPWAIGLHLDIQSVVSLARFGIKFQLNDFLARIKDQLFYLAIGWYLPNREFGYITWAKNWSMYPYQLTVQNIMTITFPTFSRIQDNKELLRRAIEKTIFAVTLVIFPILFGMSLFIRPILEFIPAYAKWLPASLSFTLFCLSIVWSAISTPLTNTLNALGRIDTTLKLMVFWTVLTWVITPIAVIFWNYDGVAIAALLISLTSGISVILTKKYVQFQFFDQVWRQLLASTMMIGLGLLGLSFVNSLTQLFILIILCGLLYVGLMFVLGKNKIYQEFLPIGRILMKKMLK